MVQAAGRLAVLGEEPGHAAERLFDLLGARRIGEPEEAAAVVAEAFAQQQSQEMAKKVDRGPE
jgi:hypothetical protein